jgi:hypothetical protein
MQKLKKTQHSKRAFGMHYKPESIIAIRDLPASLGLASASAPNGLGFTAIQPTHSDQGINL